MTPTPEQRKRLAAEARKLASEIVEGTAPRLDPGDYRYCAIGETTAREAWARCQSLYSRTDVQESDIQEALRDAESDLTAALAAKESE